MKKVLLYIIVVFIFNQSFAQQAFTVGASGITIKSGTQVFIDSLVLTPSANYTISSNSLTVSYTATSGPGAASISRICTFSSPLTAYSGGVGMYYLTSQLNGNTGTNLALAYTGNGTSWGIDNTGSYAANYVSTSSSAFSNISLEGITALNSQKYYSKSTGDITLTSNWGTNTDGSGNNPPDFSEPLNTYVLSNISGSTTLLNNWTVGGLLIINTGIDLEIGSKTLTLSDSVVCNGTIGGNGNSTLAISGRAMSLRFSTANNAIGTVALNNNSALTLLDTLKIASDPSGGVITVGSGATLNTNNYLSLQSDSNGTARIGTVSGTISGNVTINQYTTGGRRAYRFWAHPFTSSISLGQIQNYIDITGTGGATNGFTTTTSNAPSAYWYTPAYGNSSMGSDPGWRAYTNTYGTPDSNMLHKYQGMRLFIRGSKGEGLTGASYVVSPVTIALYGAVNTGNITIPLSRGTLSVSGTPVQDYNLVGNPYPSPVNINTVISNASSAGYINGTAYYVWDPYMGVSGQFETKTIGTAYDLSACTSFEVRASALTGASLSFSESNKVATGSEVLHRDEQPDYITLSVYDTTGHIWDVLYVQFNENATDGEDSKYDAGKAPGPAALNFYSLSSGNTRLSIDARPYQQGKVIPLGITSSYAYPFVIKADNLPLPANVQMFLHDKYLNKYELLSQGSEYKFAITGDVASQGDSRFELSFDSSGSAIAQTQTSLQMQLTPNPAQNQVTLNYFSSNRSGKSLAVVDVSGITVLSKDLGTNENGDIQLDISRLDAGIYMIVLSSGNEKIVQRLVKE